MTNGRQHHRSVVHINTHDVAGGAAKTAWRLALAQRRRGWRADLMVGHQFSRARHVHRFDSATDPRISQRCHGEGWLDYAHQGSHALHAHPALADSDLAHLHNLHGDYFNPFSLYPIARSKPTVWTLHDMQAITGHCAHAFDCRQWETGCGQCPHLDTEPALSVDTSRRLLADRELIYDHSPLWVVSPSQWLMDKLSRSVLRNHPATVIPNGIDTDVFHPMDRRAAREALGLAHTQVLIGAVSHGGTLANPWKGGEYTEAALEFLCEAHPNLRFVNIGGEDDGDDSRVVTIGHLSDESELARAYSALDFFLYTPRADNCPLVVLEAMACGLPVVSFDTGGVPELVVDGQQGHVVPFQDIHGLVRAAGRLLTNVPARRAMGQAARQRAEAEYGLARMTDRYLAVYETALAQWPERRLKAMDPAAVPPVIRTPAFKRAFESVSPSRLPTESQSPAVAPEPPLPGPDHFEAYCTSKRWHFHAFVPAEQLYGHPIDIDGCDLKIYQDLLVYSFILHNIPPGARLLEVGGGDSRVLKALATAYDCWNVDRLEGVGSGPTRVDQPRYRMIHAYMGEFSQELPDRHFDLVFSISALEHTPDDPEHRERICQDIDRVLAPGGYSLHLFDIRLRGGDSWTHGLLPFMYERYDTVGDYRDLASVDRDPDLYHMSRSAYDNGWRHITGKSFGDFGKPASYNILWRQPTAGTVTTSDDGTELPGAARNLQKYPSEMEWPRITLVTPSLNQGAYLEACIQSVLGQGYPNLEYLIMDGGSDDGSTGIINKYAHRLAHWQSRPDDGQYAAIQAGFDRSTGEIMGWLNADDMLHPNALFTVAQAFIERPDVRWIMGRPTVWDADGRVAHVVDPLPVWSRSDYLAGRYKDPHVQQESTFWRRALWDAAGGCLDTTFSLAADMELWSRFFRQTDLVTLDARLGGFRVHGDQKTATHMDAYDREAHRILERQRQWAKAAGWSEPLPSPEPILMPTANPRPTQPQPNDASPSPRVSVIVSTYADAAFIGECLEDLVDQTIADRMELIVIDAASPEGEGEVVRRFQSRHPRLRYHRTDRRIPVYAAWNLAIRMATGTYIMPMSANDRLAPEACERLADALDAAPDTALVYGDTHLTRTPHERFDRHTRTGTLKWPAYDYDDLLANNRVGPHPMWRRSLHDRIGLFDERYETVADQEWFLRVGWDHPMAHLEQETGLYLCHDDALSTQGERPLAENRRIRDFYLHRSIFRAQVQLNQRADLSADRTSVIILTRNNRSMTDLCLAALKRHTPGDLEVVMVDNGSTDGTAEWLQTNPFEFDRFEVIANADNLGFSRGNNQGLAIATGEAVVLLNNDVVVTDGWLDRLAAPARHNPRIGLVGPMTNAVAGPQRLARVSYDTDTLDGLDGFAHRWADRHQGESAPLWRPVGFCLWVHRSVIDRIGGLDDRFGLGNFEDDDFCLRATIAGFHGVVARDCFVHHFGSKTFVSEGIDVTDGLAANWSIFKAKWGMAEDDPYGRYDIQPFLNNDFKPEYHYQALTVRSGGGFRSNPSVPNKEVNTMSQSVPQTKASADVAAYSDIQTMIAGERFDAAVAALESYIRDCPDHGQAHADLGGLYHQQGRTDPARQCLEKAAALMPDDAGAQKQLGDFYYVVLNEITLAKKAYRAALAVDGANLDVLMLCGHLSVTEEDMDAAAGFYKEALTVAPWHGEARTYLDAVASRLSESKVATTESTATDDPIAQRLTDVKNHPEDPVAHNDLGVLYYRSGNRDAARRHYEQAVTLAPEHPVFRKNLADFYYVEDGDAKGAAAIYQTILNADPSDVDAQLGLAVIQADSGDVEIAKATAEAILDQDPAHQDARDLMDRLRATTGEEGAASPDQRHNDILTRMADADPMMMVTELEVLLEDSPIFGPGWVTLGRLRFESADVDAAIDALTRAVDLMPDHAEAIKLLADARHVGQHDVDAALAGYERARVLDPDNLELLLTMAHLHVTREDFAAAKPLYAQVVTIDPDYGDASTYLSAVETRLAKSEPPVPAPETAEPPEALYGRVAALFEADSLDDAMSALQALVAANPEFAPAHNDLGVLYYRNGDMSAAEHHYETAARLVPENPTYQKNLADFYVVVRHRFEPAMAIYVKLLSDDPTDIETLMATGHICAAMERFEDAEHFYQRVIEIEPWNTDVRPYLDAIFERQASGADGPAPDSKNTSGAPALPEGATPTQAAESLYAQAQTLMADGQRGAARSLLEQAVTADPRFAAAHNDLGVQAYRDQDLDSAVNHHQQALALDPENAVYRLNLADVYAVGCGRFGDALELYLAVLQEEPAHVDALLNIAQVCLCVERLDDAEHFLNRALEVEPWHSDARTLLDQINAKRCATAC